MRAYHYGFLATRYPVSGGLFNYVKYIFGYDRAVLVVWLMLLMNISIFWANATSVPLFACYFLRGIFEFGYLYTVFGYESVSHSTAEYKREEVRKASSFSTRNREEAGGTPSRRSGLRLCWKCGSVEDETVFFRAVISAAVVEAVPRHSARDGFKLLIGELVALPLGEREDILCGLAGTGLLLQLRRQVLEVHSLLVLCIVSRHYSLPFRAANLPTAGAAIS